MRIFGSDSNMKIGSDISRLELVILATLAIPLG